MTNHPIHIHGHEFVVSGTDGGLTPKSGRWPEVTTDIAVGQMHRGVPKKITSLIPDYMVMGERGMADMAEMGGMFTVMKVREDQRPGDYKDPGWFKHPAGTVAYEWKGALAEPTRSQSGGAPMMSAQNMPAKNIEVQVRKPQGKAGRAGH